jgi:hypothetical protein
MRVHCLAALALLPAIASAQYIDIQGTVADTNHLRIPGATVSLVDQGISALTNTNGEFRLITTGVRQNSRAAAVHQASVTTSPDAVIVNVAADGTPVEIRYFDCKGALVTPPLRYSMGAGRHAVALPSATAAASMLLVQVTIGSTRLPAMRIVRASGLRNRVSGAVVGSALAERRDLLNKQAGSPYLVLGVSAPGYGSGTQPILCISQSLSIAMAPSSRRVSGLRTLYDFRRGAVMLAWDSLQKTPSGCCVSGYRIFRGTRTDTAGNPIDMNCRLQVGWAAASPMGAGSGPVLDNPFSDSATHNVFCTSDTCQEDYPWFADTSDSVASGTKAYYYTVAPIFMDTLTRQSTQGPFSNPALCGINHAVGLAINNGGWYVTTDSCMLSVLDPRRDLTSAQFTDSAAVGAAMVSLRPIFATYSARNPITSMAMGADTVGRLAWVLPKGAGSKRVWAQVQHRDGRFDTVSTQAWIQPWHIGLTLRNEAEDPASRTMIPSPGREYVPRVGYVDAYNVFAPWVDFSVSISGDSTFGKDFEVWLAAADSGSDYQLHDATSPELAAVPGLLVAPFAALRPHWLETGVEHDSLTGYGAAHDDLNKYRYLFSPESAAGLAALDTMFRTVNKALPAAADVDPSALSTPGLFWGAAALGSSPSTGHPDVLTLPPGEAFSALGNMSPSRAAYRGKKEIAIIVRMKGRYFDDVRTVISSPAVNPDSRFITYYVATPPVIVRDKWEYAIPKEDSLIAGPFTVNTNTNGADTGDTRGYVVSRGGAKVKAVDLVVALMPESLATRWDPLATPQTITLDYLMSRPNYVLPFSIPEPVERLPGVSWQNIDPSAWPSGDYMAAFVTEDDMGHKDLAPVAICSGAPAGDYFTNPMHWRIATNHQ